MTTENLVLGICHLFSGLLMIALSLPLLKGKVGMNRWYGVRIPKAFKSPSNWYLLNSYGARQLIGAGAVLAVIGLVSLAIPLDRQLWYFWLAAFAPILVLVVPVVRIMRFSKTLP